MNISYKWLKRYIDFGFAPRELAAKLTSLGLECDTVEEVESIRGGLRGIVIGKVLTCVEHPDSDHLHITTVDLGGEAPVQIVCGAPNVAAGQTVVVATVGTTLYDGDREFQIKKSKIRGVESFGMICAEDEIGLGNSHDGIMVLPDGVLPGTPAAEYFNVESDYCLEVELTPNRVDAAGHYGVARDLKALLYCEEAMKTVPNVEIPQISVPDASSFSVDRQDGAASVEMVDTEGCPRYCGVTVRGVKVGESPEWLRNLLAAAGQRSINNVVDITNFILLGLGQPLHSFDLDKVKDEKIVVRTAPQGTKFTTLDGVEHTLDAADLMICDSEKPLCIAGVFGGLESGVTEQTTNVFIESAYFNPTRVRRTARRHGLSTDASFRYERGTDPEILIYAARLAACMIREIAGGEICGEVVDIYPSPIKRPEFDFSLDYCNSLIGKQLPRELVIGILRALEFEVDETPDSQTLHLRVPLYRVDVYRPCDVVEEVLRVYGYNNVEFDTLMHANLSPRTDTDYSYDMQNIVSEQLTGQGFCEILNNSLTSASYYKEDEGRLSLEGCVKLLNPLSNDLSVMRRTLLFGGLETIAHNVNRKSPDLKLYEFGNVYDYLKEKATEGAKALSPYKERAALGIWLTGNYTQSSWNMKSAPATPYDLIAVTDNIFRRLGVAEGMLKRDQFADELFSVALRISDRSGRVVAEAGVVSRGILKQLGIEQEVMYAEINWNVLYQLASRNEVTYKALPKTQPVTRDLALLIDKSVTMKQLEEVITKAERKLLRGVSLFDVFEGPSLPPGKKSYAVSMTLQDPEKTLNDRQIDAVMQKIIKALEGFGATLR